MEPQPAIQRDTLANQAYRALRGAILARRYPLGARLVVRELAETLGLSPTPIKEALAALAREGLVQATPHKGYQVPAPSLEDMREVYELRETLEGLAARLAASRGGKNLGERLEAILQNQEEAAARGDLEAYGDLDLAFHRTLWEASQNERLRQSAENLHGLVRLLISTTAALPGRLPQSLSEHRLVLEKVVAKDPDAAENAMRQHVRQAWKALEAFLDLM